MGRRCPALAPSDRWPRRPKKGRLRPGALGSTILPALRVHFGIAGPSGAAGVPGFVTSATSDLTYGCFFQPSVVFLYRNVDYQVLMQTYSLNICFLELERFDNYLDKNTDLKKQWCWIFNNLATYSYGFSK